MNFDSVVVKLVSSAEETRYVLRAGARISGIHAQALETARALFKGEVTFVSTAAVQYRTVSIRVVIRRRGGTH